MIFALSSWQIGALCVAGLVLLLLAAPAVRSFGRAAEEVTDMGHKVSKDHPDFRRPPDESHLL